MQKTVLVNGWFPNDRNCKLIDEKVNQVLEENPGYRLSDVVVVDASEVDCTVLCVLTECSETNTTD